MKKIFALAIVVVALSSCKKDYSCTCSVAGAASTTVDYPGLSKSEAEDAEAACNAGSVTLLGISTTCTWSEK
jgi:hypothetical protein